MGRTDLIWVVFRFCSWIWFESLWFFFTNLSCFFSSFKFKIDFEQEGKNILCNAPHTPKRRSEEKIEWTKKKNKKEEHNTTAIHNPNTCVMYENYGAVATVKECAFVGKQFSFQLCSVNVCVFCLFAKINELQVNRIEWKFGLRIKQRVQLYSTENSKPKKNKKKKKQKKEITKSTSDFFFFK